MKHWDKLIFDNQMHETEKGPIIFLNITNNNMSDCEVNINDTIIYTNQKYKVIGIERMVKTFNDINGNPLPGDNFIFLLEKQVDEIKDSVRQMVEKWNATGYLEDLTEYPELSEMAKLLECEPIQKIERI